MEKNKENDIDNQEKIKTKEIGVKELEKKPDINENIPNKSNKGIIITLVIIIFLLILALVYVLFIKKDDDKDSQEVIHKPTSEAIPTSKPEVTETPINDARGDYELTVYKYKDGGYLSTDNKKNDYLEEAFKIEVNTQNAKLLAVDYYNDFLVLINDDGLYIYNDKTKSKEKINLEDAYKNYTIYMSEDDNKIIGIGYTNKDNKYGYYNVAKKVKLYDGKYEGTAYQINDKYLSMSTDGMVYLLSADNESTKLSYKCNESICEYGSFGKNGDYIIGLGRGFDETGFVRFYSKDLQMFYEVTDDNLIWDNAVEYSNGHLYIVKNNNILKYNTNGDLLSTITDYSNIERLISNYVVYIKDNNLIIENLEDSSESKVLTKWDKTWEVDGFDSGYYTRNTLDHMGEKDKKEGAYVVILYGYDNKGNAVKDSKGYYGIEYCYTPSKEVIEYPIREEKGGRAKPVLYLYPTEETNVTVTFAHPEYLTTTYPKYIKSWNVTAKPNGDLYDKDGKYYYALYWDEKRYNEVDFSSGFYVEGKDAIKFLEEKLTYIGLNDKERNEFIMYWLPIMEANDKNLVYFELTSEREAGNKLIIEPKPDSLLRISIHIKKVNQKINIKEQKLESFNRTGFAAIEWGGMTY